MRTSLFLLAGFLLLGASATVGRLFSSNYPDAPLWATIVFIAVWLAPTGTTLWVGVNRAGYSFAEELPVRALLFGIPTLVAALLKWKVL